MSKTPTALHAPSPASASPLIEVTREDFVEEGLQYVIGVSPCQIDFLTTMPGAISFEDSWCKKENNKTKEGFPIHYLGKADLITAKKTAGRPQDLADLDELRRADLDCE